MTNKVGKVQGEEYILTHVGQPTLNGCRCKQYEVRRELEGQNA
ncbi:hypothetical protein [Tianweitania sediminis]|nr:hypothetical protein [Tianweitania sediminis]